MAQLLADMCLADSDVGVILQTFNLARLHFHQQGLVAPTCNAAEAEGSKDFQVDYRSSALNTDIFFAVSMHTMLQS